MGSAPAAGFGGSPGCWWVLDRSSSHSAQGHASRRNGNGKWDVWPPFHSISTPVPVVKLTFTDFGSATAAMNSVSHSRTGAFASELGELSRVGDSCTRELSKVTWD